LSDIKPTLNLKKQFEARKSKARTQRKEKRGDAARDRLEARSSTRHGRQKRGRRTKGMY
jgi:hypothetical protein